MNLKEYIKANRIDVSHLVKLCKVCIRTIEAICERNTTPSLKIALIIYNFCDGEVDLEMLLSKSMYENLQEFKSLRSIPCNIEFTAENYKPTLSMAEYLGQKNLSQIEFAGITGLSYGTINKIFIGITPAFYSALVIFYSAEALINIETLLETCDYGFMKRAKKKAFKK